MSKNKQDVVVFRGGKGPNRWWISLDWPHRQLLGLAATAGGTLVLDSVFRNTLDLLQVHQMTEQQLRFGADTLVTGMLLCGSAIYTKMIRDKALLEDERELLKQDLLAFKEAQQQWFEEKKQLLEERDALADLVLEDPFTGLFNRRGAMKILTQYSGKATRSKGEIHILFIDLDKLKYINTEFGHVLGGDIAIKEVAQAIKSTFRKEEPGCRYGGDEFLGIFLYEKVSPENLSKTECIKKRLINTVNRVHIMAMPINSPSQGYKKIPIGITVSTHVVDLKNTLENELNTASEKLLKLKEGRSRKE